MTTTFSYLDSLTDTLYRRANKCIKLASPHLSKGEYYLAGSCIASSIVNDIDVFPVIDEYLIPSENVIIKTPSATTIKNDPPIQFCTHKKSSLKELIESFDFSHVQAGVRILNGEVVCAAWTDAYLAYRLTSVVQFTGTDYPLSSLFRLFKYYKRGDVGKESAGLTISIVAAIVKRGFNGYEDFKRQLDAVDLELIPEEIDNLVQEDLRTFFNLLDRK